MINKLIVETLPKLISLCVEAGNYQVSNHLQDNKFSSKDNDTPPCLLYTSPSPRDVEESRMPSSA